MHLLVREYVGRFHQIAVDGNAAFIIEVGIRNGSAMDFTF
jgi:hypothetical protein